MAETSIAANFVKTAFNRLDLSAVRAPLMLSLLNQMLTSGGNFLIGIYLARTLPLEGFGLYGIGYGICTLYVGMGNAVIVTQMVVNMPDREHEEKQRYAAKMLYAVLLLGGAMLVLTAAASFLATMISPEFANLLTTVAAVAITAALFLCHDFFVSYAYLIRKESLALVVNGVMMAVLFAGLALGKVVGITLTAQKALLLYAFGVFAGSAIAYLASPLRLRGSTRNLKSDFLEAWRQGRWALGGVGITWVQSQTYTYVLAFFLGPAGVGQANAARIFISPFSFLLPAINKVAIPRLADLRRSNPKKMLMVSWLLTAGMTLLALLYSLILLVSLHYVAPKLLGRHDPVIESLVWVWCLVLVFQMLRSGGGVLLQIQRKFRILTLVNIPSAVITIAAAVALIAWLGAAGAIWGMVAGELVLLLLIWKEIWHGRAQYN